MCELRVLLLISYVPTKTHCLSWDSMGSFTALRLWFMNSSFQLLPYMCLLKASSLLGLRSPCFFLLQHLHFLRTKSESVINILRLLILDYTMFLVYLLVIKYGLMKNHQFVPSFFHLDAVIGDFPTQPFLICKGINWISA